MFLEYRKELFVSREISQVLAGNRADAAAFFENEFFPMMKSMIAKQFPQK